MRRGNSRANTVVVRRIQQGDRAGHGRVAGGFVRRTSRQGAIFTAGNKYGRRREREICEKNGKVREFLLTRHRRPPPTPPLYTIPKCRRFVHASRGSEERPLADDAALCRRDRGGHSIAASVRAFWLSLDPPKATKLRTTPPQDELYCGASQQASEAVRFAPNAICPRLGQKGRWRTLTLRIWPARTRRRIDRTAN